MQDINDQEMLKQYTHPVGRGSDEHKEKGDPRGFVVREAPWSSGGGGGKGNAPDTLSTEDFPEFGATVSKPSSAPIAWGPRRK